jgi:hypothetical protein
VRKRSFRRSKCIYGMEHRPQAVYKFPLWMSNTENRQLYGHPHGELYILFLLYYYFIDTNDYGREVVA